jgi:hypothetical protein
MFDAIIPIGQTCNITLLLQNAKLKKQTTLFEWFISPNLTHIIETINKIAVNNNDDIVTEKKGNIFMGESIYTSHYSLEDYKPIYKRRRERLLDIIRSSKTILFCRFEASPIVYTKKDIDDFLNSILNINSNITDIKLLLITPKLDLEHPNVMKVFYNKHSTDPYCKSDEINNLFADALQKIGYDCTQKVNTVFTDRSEL